MKMKKNGTARRIDLFRRWQCSKWFDGLIKRGEKDRLIALTESVVATSDDEFFRAWKLRRHLIKQQWREYKMEENHFVGHRAYVVKDLQRRMVV